MFQLVSISSKFRELCQDKEIVMWNKGLQSGGRVYLQHLVLRDFVSSFFEACLVLHDMDRENI